MPNGLTATELLALLPVPCCLTDEAGRAIERNGAFMQLGHRLSLHVSTGRLRFGDPYLQDSWEVALGEVHATAIAQAILVTAADGTQWRMHLLPLHCALELNDPLERAMVLALAEQLPMTADRTLESFVAASTRPLTPAETEVLNAMLQGHTAKIIASARGASVNTVRSQIMAILEKTGHHNQKSLMAAFSPSTFGNSAAGAQSSVGAGTSLPPRKR